MIEYTTGVINLKLITPFCALQHTFYVGSKPKSVFYENLEFVLYGNLATVAKEYGRKNGNPKQIMFHT